MLQLVGAPLSRTQLIRQGDSLHEKVNCASDTFVAAGGCVSSWVVGEVVSTVHCSVVGVVWVLPAGSTATTVKVCSPSASPVSVAVPLEQSVACVSIVHWKLQPVSSHASESVALERFEGSTGGLEIVAVGGMRSIVQVNCAGVASETPDVSVAVTWKVCAPSFSPVKLAVPALQSAGASESS